MGLAALTQSLSNLKFRLNWKLRRADRNVLDAPQEAKKLKSKKLLHIERPRARYVCTAGGAENWSPHSHFVTCAFTRRLTQPLLDFQIHSGAHPTAQLQQLREENGLLVSLLGEEDFGSQKWISKILRLNPVFCAVFAKLAQKWTRFLSLGNCARSQFLSCLCSQHVSLCLCRIQTHNSRTSALTAAIFSNSNGHEPRHRHNTNLMQTTGEATPRGPQTIPIFRTQNQGTRSSLMKTTSARQKALAKLKRADRNVLDASQC